MSTAKAPSPRPVLSIEALSVHFPTAKGIVHAVSEVSLQIPQGRSLGFIGESGSGKTTTALAVMRMLAQPGYVAGGQIHLGGKLPVDLLSLSDEEMRKTRLRRLSYIPQGAMNSLNPVMRVAPQIWDGITAHEGAKPPAELQERSRAALASVGLSDQVGRLYPHELSGGMKQRVCIAIAVALTPDLIIADEPTSALDVITQRHVMQTLREAQTAIGASLLLIGHDMGLMAQSVDDLAVLKLGELVEFGSARQMLTQPKHDYTKALIRSIPLVGGPNFLSKAKEGVEGSEGSKGNLIEFSRVHKAYSDLTALRPLSFTLNGKRPKLISIVGQSGSGKSTLGALLLGFTPPSAGSIRFMGQDINRLGPADRLLFRRQVQAVFQDPYASFNPFYRVQHALRFPYKKLGLAASGDATGDTTEAAMQQACAAVGLDGASILSRYPHQLSGGQRQRLLVARALMLSPKLLVADEPVSMVDASLRASILKNIYDLKESHGISIFYITHDLATAYHVSDYVMVLYKGKIVEAGPPEAVIGDPQHAYTQLLISSIPWPDVDRDWGSVEAAEDALQSLETLQDEPTLMRGEIEGFLLQTD